jgi:hypothetical protein
MRNTTRDPAVRVAAVRGTVAVLAATSLALGVAPSHAAPTPKLGAVKGLDLTVSKSGGSYDLASDWDDLTGATAYRVSLSSAGTVLQSDKVTGSDWTSTTTLGAGNTITVKVVPLAGKKPGKPASVSEELPDVTKPVGTFHVVQDTPGSQHITVVQDTLSDDLTPADSIVRTISWDQGMPAEAWTDGSHTYTEDLRAYQPSVTLVDLAGNTRVVALGTVVVGDHTPPTGAFESTASGWAGWSKIALNYTQDLHDNFSEDRVTCTVAWGDGSTDTWTGGAVPTHEYDEAGTYEATVTLADEAGNTTVAPVITVEVTADTARPTVKLTKPKRLKSVRAWKRLKGKASDVDGTGVRNVKVRIVEKRHGRWFAYKAPTRTWVRGGSTKATAFKRSRPAKVVPVDGVWRYRVAGLRKGSLVVKVKGTDNVGNPSKARTYSQLLSRR